MTDSDLLLIQAAGIYECIDRIERKVVLSPSDMADMYDLKMQEAKMRRLICQHVKQLMEKQNV